MLHTHFHFLFTQIRRNCLLVTYKLCHLCGYKHKLNAVLKENRAVPLNRAYYNTFHLWFYAQKNKKKHR